MGSSGWELAFWTVIQRAPPHSPDPLLPLTSQHQKAEPKPKTSKTWEMPAPVKRSILRKLVTVDQSCFRKSLTSLIILLVSWRLYMCKRLCWEVRTHDERLSVSFLELCPELFRVSRLVALDLARCYRWGREVWSSVGDLSSCRAFYISRTDPHRLVTMKGIKPGKYLEQCQACCRGSIKLLVFW